MGELENWEKLPERIVINTFLIRECSDLTEQAKALLEALENLGCSVRAD